MSDNKVITCDASAFLAAVESLTELTERIPKLVDGLLGVRELGFELASVVVRDDSALRTSDVRTCLQPSDRLLRLVAALTAWERECLVIKELIHG
jgi:hypothetical protein